MVQHIKGCAHGLVVGDALGIGATNETLHTLRNGHLALLDNLEILDRIDHSHRRKECNAVDLLIQAVAIGNLDNRLGAHTLAFEIQTERDALRCAIELHNADNLEELIRRNVVDYRAILNGANLLCLIIVYHSSLYFLTPNK